MLSKIIKYLKNGIIKNLTSQRFTLKKKSFWMKDCNTLEGNDGSRTLFSNFEAEK